MNKLAIIQIILGALVVGSLIYWMGWLSSGYHIREGIAPDGTIIRSFPLLIPNPALDVWSIHYPALGLADLGCGIAQYFRTGRKRLAVAQTVLGVLVVSSLVWFIGWVEWDYGPYIRVTERYGEIEMKHLPGWEMRLMIWKVVSFIIGLGVAYCGAAQLIKRGKMAIPVRSESKLGTEEHESYNIICGNTTSTDCLKS